MSTTSGYGETPVGSNPEQPEWLRKQAAATPSGHDDVAHRDAAAGPYAAGPYGAGAQPAGYPNAQPVSGYPAPAQYPSPPPYQSHAQPQHQTPPQYPTPPQYQAQPPYPGAHPGAQPAPYLRQGPWAPVDPHAKSRLAAGLLGIFLGAFGIHRFYLGYTGVGVAMLLMTVLSFGILGLVTTIWGLVEGILYLTDKTGKYSRDATGRPLRD